ncbi:MAG: SRPBCC family protein [Thermomicrobiales bacterium]
MARPYYSTVFEQTADQVWYAIRAFGSYDWADGVSESAMEDGKADDAVGGIRSFHYGGERMRQRLLAHSDLDRCYTFDLCDPSPMRNYQATLRVTPIVDGNRAFVEWWATFDCAADEYDQWMTFLEKEGFPKWLGSLRANLAMEASTASQMQ